VSQIEYDEFIKIIEMKRAMSNNLTDKIIIGEFPARQKTVRCVCGKNKQTNYKYETNIFTYKAYISPISDE